MKIWPIIDEVLMRPPALNAARMPTFYPSAASTLDEETGEPIGACLRANYYRCAKYPKSNEDSVWSQYVFGGGNLWEGWLADKLKSSGILLASNLKFADLNRYISGEVDMVVKEPETGKKIILECCLPGTMLLDHLYNLTDIALQVQARVISHTNGTHRILNHQLKDVLEEPVVNFRTAVSPLCTGFTLEHPILRISQEDNRDISKASFVKAEEVKIGDFFLMPKPLPLGSFPGAVDSSSDLSWAVMLFLLRGHPPHDMSRFATDTFCLSWIGENAKELFKKFLDILENNGMEVLVVENNERGYVFRCEKFKDLIFPYVSVRNGASLIKYKAFSPAYFSEYVKAIEAVSSKEDSDSEGSFVFQTNCVNVFNMVLYICLYSGKACCSLLISSPYRYVLSIGSDYEGAIVPSPPEDSHWLVPVFGIHKSQYSGPVYNMEVDVDNSYVAGGIAVHNCKTAWGYEAKKKLAGNKSVQPSPKDPNLLQAFLYLDQFKDEVEEVILFYFFRDDHTRVEFSITRYFEDGLTYPRIETTWQNRALSYVDKRISMEGIYLRYESLMTHLKKAELPPADYDHIFSPEKVEEMWEKGQIPKTKYANWSRNKEKYPIGYFLCGQRNGTGYCGYRDQCWDDKQAEKQSQEEGLLDKVIKLV